jgi:predicted RNA-binding protein with PUA-like domain
MPAHFLVKSEPYKYAFETLQKDKRTRWDGVRNFEARNNLRAMKNSDLLLFYHSNEGKEVVGVAKVVRTAYPDPTAKEGDWSAVDVAPVKALASPVSLEAIRADKKLASIQLLRRSRLSVVPVTPGEFARVLELGKTKL